MRILYIEPILKTPYVWLCVCLLIAGVISIIVSGILDECNLDFARNVSFFIGAVLITIFLIIGLLFKKPTGLYKYKVAFDEGYQIDISEFLDEYKVIDKEGDLYILEDREVKED